MKQMKRSALALLAILGGGAGPAAAVAAPPIDVPQAILALEAQQADLAPGPQAELRGGFYRAGSGVKMTADSLGPLSALIWVALDHPEWLGSPADQARLVELARWQTAYLLEAYRPGRNGDPGDDVLVAMADTAEGMAYATSAACGGADLAADAAAALGAMSSLFYAVGDDAYAELTFERAREMLAFAQAYPGRAAECAPGRAASGTGKAAGQADLGYAAGWVHRAGAQRSAATTELTGWRAQAATSAAGLALLAAADGYPDIGFDFARWLAGRLPAKAGPAYAKALTSVADIDFRTKSVWDTGFTADVSIKNTTGSAVTSWELGWDFPAHVKSVWSGSLVRSHPYVLRNASYNGRIGAGGSVIAGFNADGKLDPASLRNCTLNSQPCRFLVNGRPIDGGTTPPPPPPPPPPPAGSPVWSESFEARNPGDQWVPRSSSAVVASGCGVGGGKCFRVTYVPQKDDGKTGSPVIQGAQTLPPADEYTLNYDLFFENDFEFVRGGKLPGLSPNSWGSGCESVKVNEWSERLMWRGEGRFQLYTYHQDRDNRCGDENTAPNFNFQKNRWYAVSVRVKVNTAGNLSDGFAELYVNGSKIVERRNVRFRGEVSDATRVTKMLFSTFFGGTNNASSGQLWYPSRPVHARFDNFAVYRGLRVRPQPGQ